MGYSGKTNRFPEKMTEKFVIYVSKYIIDIAYNNFFIVMGAKDIKRIAKMS